MPESKNVEAASPAEPREGGLQAWLVVLASFLVNGLVFGVINSYSVLYFELQKNLNNAGVSDSSSKAVYIFPITHV
ncbi:hypothetical protein B566_EDAN010893 [Ephemera danica]|nr:hypothetical protein B566_EDAN010893 [Ephemera danica]